MGIADKINNAKPVSWVTDGLSENEVISIVKSAREYARNNSRHSSNADKLNSHNKEV